MKETTPVPVAPTQAVASVETFISQALASNASIETMERLYALYEKEKKDRAKSAFMHALAQFQAECPVLKKDKKVLNKGGVGVRYMYATLGSAITQIAKPLTKAQLSYRWETVQEDSKVKAICYVTHVLGHTESSDFTVPVDPEAFMTAPQKFASALTFAKRYALFDALGIVTGDEDTDATDVGKEPEAKSNKSKIMFLLKELGEKTTDKTEIAVEVERLTGLKLEEKNYTAIVKKLEAKVIAKNHEDPTIQ